MGKSFSERAGRVADIILEQNHAGKAAKTKKIGRETVSMLKEMNQRFIGMIAKQDLHRAAGYGAGRLSGLTTRAYRKASHYFKKIKTRERSFS